MIINSVTREITDEATRIIQTTAAGCFIYMKKNKETLLNMDIVNNTTILRQLAPEITTSVTNVIKELIKDDI